MATPLPVHPILGPTALPIHVADSPDIWITYVSPAISTVAAVVAAIAALWALRSVHLSKRAFLLAQSEAAIAERERNRRPHLHLVLDGRRGAVDTIISTAETDKPDSDFMRATIENDGDKPARNIVIDLRLPKGISDDSYLQRSLNDAESDFGEAITFDLRAEDGADRAVKSIAGILLPNTVPAEAGTIYFRATLGEYDVPWFISSEEGTWNGTFRVGVRTYDD